MPFIEEQDLVYLHKQIESEIEERNKIETRFRKKNFELEDTKRKVKMFQITSILFALGLLGAIGYAMKQSTKETVEELTPQEIEVQANKYLEEQGLAAIPQDSLDTLTETAFKYEMMNLQFGETTADDNSTVNSDNSESTTATTTVEISDDSVNSYLEKQDLVAISKDALASLKTKATAYDTMDKNPSSNTAQTFSGENPFKGYVYSVGIGSLKKNGVKLNSGEFSNFKMFQGNLDTYSIGNFKTYKEATAFKLNVRKYLKIKDAYLVAYKDGKHISVKDALKENGK